MSHRDQSATRAIVMPHATQGPLYSEITQATRDVWQAQIESSELKPDEALARS